MFALISRRAARAADALTIEPDGATLLAKRINFGNRLGALLTLWNPDYVTGIQPSTFYQRSAKNFAWYKGGQHTDTELDPGGGSTMMSLTDGTLTVSNKIESKGDATVQNVLKVTGDATLDKSLTVSGPVKIYNRNALEFGANVAKSDSAGT